MAEILARLVDDEANRMPAANSYKLYYTATDPTTYGLNVCNGEDADAHVGIFLVEAAYAWIDGDVPAPYQAIHKNQRVEADGTDGNGWVMPTCVLNAGDRIVVWTDLVGTTFNGHGWKFTG